MARKRRFTAAELGIEPAASAPRGRREGGPSTNEARYGEHLEALRLAGEVLAYIPQPRPVELAHRCSYTADFIVTWTDPARPVEYVEVKGRKGNRPWYRDDGARIKVRVAARVLGAQGVLVVVVWPKRGGGWGREVVPA
jgi:hypothetical protein